MATCLFCGEHLFVMPIIDTPERVQSHHEAFCLKSKKEWVGPFGK